jgi:tripartite-type tricarboxylate transporter receptor subunit TctC
MRDQAYLTLIVALSLNAGLACGQQQAYPVKPVRIIVPFSAASASDIMARLFAQKLSESLAQQFVVENRDGAGGTVGGAAAARSAADGYTLLLVGGEFTKVGHLYTKLSYDPMQDFTPVAMYAVLPNVLIAHPSLPTPTVRELIALARAQPGKLNYASSAKGSSGHLYMELLKSMARIDIVEVPYKSSAQALSDVIGGQIALNMPALPAVIDQVKAGRVRALAVSSARRAAALPEVPSMNESAGLTGYDAVSRYGFVVPTGVPADIAARLQSEILKVIAQPDMQKRIQSLGAEIVAKGGDDFRKEIAEESAVWGKLIQVLAIRID